MSRSRGRVSASPARADNAPQLFFDHLGWGSAPLTQALKTACSQVEEAPQKERIVDSVLESLRGRAEPEAETITAQVQHDRFVKLYPDLALAMLRNGIVSAGRIWLVLHFIDKKGSGRVSLARARKCLTRSDSDLYLCGRRQLRKLLARGDGLFWRRDKNRIWLRSASKVASSLEIQKLTGSPVAVPIDVLLKGVGLARAHFYASFHSGRNPAPESGKQARPIARSTLQQLSHTSRSSQQRYERRAGIKCKSNMAVGGISTIEHDQQVAWKHGTAAFRFTDSRGTVGREGVSYTAWQLPNNYQGPHDKLPKGKLKRINRELADLFMKGMTGNGNDSGTLAWCSARNSLPGGERVIRLFHEHGLSAAACYSRSPHLDAYWPERKTPIGSYQLWFLLHGSR